MLKEIATLRSCNLTNVFVPYLNFLEITDFCPYFEFHENWVFQIFSFCKKNACKKDIFSKFSNRFYFPLGCAGKFILGTF